MKSLNEIEIIKLAQKYFSKKSEQIIKSIGDDTAVVLPIKDGYELITSDMLVENTHFLFDKITPFDLGWKSLAVNISDIASMGGKPNYAILSLGLNSKITYEWLEDFYKGIKECADKYNTYVIGGDTTFSEKTNIINITIFGNSERPIYRDGIQNNNILVTTGTLGDSGLGLWLLQNKNNYTDNETFCIKKHNKPTPRVDEGIFLNSNISQISMMDCSDGLFSSCKTLSEQSNLGIEIFSEKIPISRQLKDICKKYNKSDIDFAFFGGEDYELICSMSKNDYDLIYEIFYNKFNIKLSYIGNFTNKHSEIYLNKKGNLLTIQDKGFQHF